MYFELVNPELTRLDNLTKICSYPDEDGFYYLKIRFTNEFYKFRSVDDLCEWIYLKLKHTDYFYNAQYYVCKDKQELVEKNIPRLAWEELFDQEQINILAEAERETVKRLKP